MAFSLRNISKTSLFAAGITYIKLQQISDSYNKKTHIKIITTMDNSAINTTQSVCMIKLNDINEASLSVVPLHQHPNLMKQCCELINEEWPRSETARMLSLQTSCDKMPTCLILLTDDKVIGHCKITPVPSIKDSCFIESVVISKALRGKGLGTFLMQASEEYCRSVLHLKTIYLSTKDQEEFYSKLGYDICEPITIYGGFAHYQHIQSLNKTNNSIRPNNTCSAPPPPPMNAPVTAQGKSNKTFMVKTIL